MSTILWHEIMLQSHKYVDNMWNAGRLHMIQEKNVEAVGMEVPQIRETLQGLHYATRS